MFGDVLQPTHLLILLAVALILLGPKRLPEAGRSLGSAIHGFRRSVTGADALPNAEGESEAALSPSAPVGGPAESSHPARAR